MSAPLRRRGVLMPVLAGMTVLAWTALWMWERSPYGRYLDHGGLSRFDLVCVAPSSGPAPAVLYVGGWVLMTAAMMLPSTFPLLEIFRRLTRRRPDSTRLVGLLIVGYLGVWLAFGVAAHTLDYGLHRLLERGASLQTVAWVYGAGPLLLAGAYQFSSLKHRCLDQCRTPLSFVAKHWRGGNAAAEAWRLGVHHGAWCVGCCWALMLLMFAVGTGNVGWMLALGVLMAIEKNLSWGRRLSAPLGAALLLWGGLIALEAVPGWPGW